MSQPVDDFRNYLVSNGKRLTREQETIAKVVFALRPPFTADEVVNAVSLLKSKSKLSRSTIFRTLESLVESGLITTEVISGNPQFRHPYEPQPQISVRSHICNETHKEMIAGTCPWCGLAIINRQSDDGIS